jgi:hypothetical protein
MIDLTLHIKKISVILKKYGLMPVVVNQFNIEFVSPKQYKLKLFYNELEHGFYVELCFIENGYIITDDILKSVFNSTLKIENQVIENFIYNVELFLNTYSRQIFLEENVFEILESYQLVTSNEYTKNLIMEFQIEKLYKFWKEKNFQSYVSAFDIIDKENVTNLEKNRYEYAKKQISKSKY